MADSKKLVWDKIGERTFETGVDKGVLFPSTTDPENPYAEGVAWSGLAAVNENPSGADATTVYADNIAYLTLRSAEKYASTIEAYMYPDEFAYCNGEKEIVKGVRLGQQNRKMFGLAYRTLVGNDLEGTDYDEKLHIVYGLTVSPSEKAHQTVNESVEANTMSWSAESTPVAVSMEGCKATSSIEISKRNVGAEKYKTITDIIWGTDAIASRLPLPDEVIGLLTDKQPASGGSGTDTQGD
jgi:hypothetical protein